MIQVLTSNIGLQLANPKMPLMSEAGNDKEMDGPKIEGMLVCHRKLNEMKIGSLIWTIKEVSSVYDLYFSYNSLLINCASFRTSFESLLSMLHPYPVLAENSTRK